MKKKGHSDGDRIVLVELKQMFGDLTLNVILKMIAGKRYSVATNEDEKKEACRVQIAWREFFYFAGLFAVGDAIPYLRWLDLGGHEKAMKKTAKEMDAIVGGWLEEHKRKRELGEEGDDIEEPGDIMDALIFALEGVDLGGYDADTINKATCLNLIAGGSDPTFVTLTWAISLLLNNHRVLKKAQEELDTEIGRERTVTESDISKLVYIQAIVKETCVYTLHHHYQHHMSSIKSASWLPCPQGYTVNHKSLENSDRPSNMARAIRVQTREISDYNHKDVDVRGQHFELIPFGSGKRSCPGLSFGLQMVQFTLASFLHAFQISAPSNAGVDMSESFGLTNVKATLLEVLIKPCLSFELYK